MSILHGRKKHEFAFRVFRASTSGRRVGMVHLPNTDAGLYDGRIELNSHVDTFVSRRN